MGRSVSALDGATTTAYQSFGPDEDYYRELFDEEVEGGWADPDDDFDQWMWSNWELTQGEEWDSLVEGIRYAVLDAFPDFEEWDEVIDRELLVIAKDEYSLVAISEYGGIVSISLGNNYDRSTYWADPDEEHERIGEAWRDDHAEEFLRLFGEYEKIGTFSNGESAYRKAVHS